MDRRSRHVKPVNEPCAYPSGSVIKRLVDCRSEGWLKNLSHQLSVRSWLGTREYFTHHLEPDLIG